MFHLAHMKLDCACYVWLQVAEIGEYLRDRRERQGPLWYKDEFLVGHSISPCVHIVIIFSHFMCDYCLKNKIKILLLKQLCKTLTEWLLVLFFVIKVCLPLNGFYLCPKHFISLVYITSYYWLSDCCVTQKLPSGLMKEARDSGLEVNRGKCRYKGLYPCTPS